MVKVTAAEVNKLRKTTGAGMMDCKKALVESNGDFDAAIEILRKKGQKVAAKRADRESSEGVAIAIANEDNSSGVGIVLACETDFVGKNEDFISLAHKIASTGLNCRTKEELLNSDIDGMSIEEKLIEQTGVIGEKIQINDFKRIDGDFDAAIEILRKKGQKVAAKRADRESSEGVAIAIANEDNSSGVGIVLACETDFVGKNEDFISLAHKIASAGLNCKTKEELLKSDIDGMSIEEKLIEQTGVIGEKIQINDFSRIDADFVGTYIHAGNKISSLVGFSNKCENIEIAAKDISMQIAAMNPIALDEDSVDSAVIEKEIEIAKDQLRAEGKPEEMLDKIAQGKLKRFFKDNTLIHQAFIKDSKQSVSQYLSSFSTQTKITSYSRVSIG